MMTESEWLTSDDPQAMLAILTGWGNRRFKDGHVNIITDRKLRLWCAECAAASYGLAHAVGPEGGYARWIVGDPDEGEADSSPLTTASSWAETNDIAHGEIGRPHKAALLRDIVGNPFRPRPDALMYTAPLWHAADEARLAVFSIARTIYAERDFAALPILADALADAGCTDDDVLAHLRHPGPHVRGCWALGLVLGKE